MSDPKSVIISRKSFLSKGLKWLGGIVGLSLATGVYSYGWERTWLEVVRMSLTIPGLPESFRGSKLIHFSDVHLGHYMDLFDLDVIVSTIQKEQPDIICFTGDLVDESIEPLTKAVPILGQLQARWGKFTVLGNHDYALGKKKPYRMRGQQQALKYWKIGM